METARRQGYRYMGISMCVPPPTGAFSSSPSRMVLISKVQTQGVFEVVNVAC